MDRPAEWQCVPLIQTTAEYFSGKGIASARLDAELLLRQATGLSRLDMLTRPDVIVRDPELSRFRELVRRRAAGEPVAYLTGKKEFWSLPFEVNASVLVPRPETETLVDAALVFLKTVKGPARILDIGTGSGCIAVALAHDVPSARIVATDVSREALVVAARNAVGNGAVDRIAFRHGSVYAPVAGETFHCVVSNPPYIAADDPAVDAGVCKFEPSQALFAGKDGLDIFRQLASGLDAVLEEGGAAFFEIGAGQAQAVSALFRDAGFAGCTVVRDLAGHPRVLNVTRVPVTDAPRAETVVEMIVERFVEPVVDDGNGVPVAPVVAHDAAVNADSPRESVDDAELERLMDAYAEGGDEEPEEDQA